MIFSYPPSLEPSREGSYPGLAPEALYTSLLDLETIMNSVPDLGTWVDLGSGTGQGPLMYGSLFPDRKSIGMEFVEERFQIGKTLQEKWQLSNVELILGDLSVDPIPMGDTYFFYFPTGPVLDRILHELFKRPKTFKLVVIESHGDFLDRLEKEEWLLPIQKIPLHSPRHHPYAIVYQAEDKKRGKGSFPYDLSFQETYLLVEESDGRTWWGESRGLEGQSSDRFVLKHPPRSFHWDQVREIRTWNEISQKFHPALGLRRLGELRILTREGERVGHLRKIMVRPSFSVEISNGEQVEWDDIITIHWGQILCYASSSSFFFLPPAP